VEQPPAEELRLRRPAQRRPGDPSTQNWLFLAFALAFAIKVRCAAAHLLPDAHTEAPAALDILAGVMLKMGTYGFSSGTRCHLFPQAALAWAPTHRRAGR